jgi:hypothetical protein
MTLRWTIPFAIFQLKWVGLTNLLVPLSTKSTLQCDALQQGLPWMTIVLARIIREETEDTAVGGDDIVDDDDNDYYYYENYGNDDGDDMKWPAL